MSQGTEAPSAPPDQGERPSSEPPPPAETTEERVEPEARQPASYGLFAVVATVATALDLVTKELAAKALTGPKRVKARDEDFVLIKGFFELRYARNNGGAWSALSDLAEIWRRPFFLFVSTAASVFIVSIYSRIDRRDLAMKWGLPIALGGAAGNLVDRIRHGYVVDFLHAFIEVKGQRKTWPTFNVADVWIVVGVGLMAISLFFGRSRAMVAPEEPARDRDDDTPLPPPRREDLEEPEETPLERDPAEKDPGDEPLVNPHAPDR